ncbi:MAG: asparaginase [Phycisphaerales bacterium]|nr:asparaginase [Phycisphaerales bacterium]
MRHIELITTGGTIEKTYDERAQELTNRGSIVQRMLRRLKLVDARVHVRELMSKDSLHMTAEDRGLIVRAARAASELSDAVVILHGTDTLCLTGETLARELGTPRVPVVLTGAMRPFEMKSSDALQNLTEALLAGSLMPPGVYVAAHGRVLKFPGVQKDHDGGTFARASG